MDKVPTILYLGENESANHNATVVANKELAEKTGNDWWRVTVNNHGVTIIKTDHNEEVVDFFAVPFKRAEQIHGILKENL